MRIIHTLLIALLLFVASSSQAQNEIRTPPDSGFVPPLVATYGDGDIGRSAVWLDDRTIAAAGARGVWIIDILPILENPSSEIPPLEKRLLEHPNGVNAVAVNLQTMQLASVGWQTVRVWDLTTETLIAEFPGTDTAVAFSPDGSLLLTAELIEDGRQTRILVWDTSDYTEPRGIIPHFEWFTGRIVFSPDGSLVAISEVYVGNCMESSTTNVRIWQIEDEVPGSAPVFSVNTGLEHSPFFFTSDGELLVFPQNRDGSPILRKVEITNVGEFEYAIGEGIVDQLFVDAEGQVIYRSRLNNNTTWWRWNAVDDSVEEIRQVSGAFYAAAMGSVSPNGQYVLLPATGGVQIFRNENMAQLGWVTGEPYVTGFSLTDSAVIPWAMSSDEMLSRLELIDGGVLLSEDGSIRVRQSQGSVYYDNGYDIIFSFENLPEDETLSSIIIEPPLLMNRMEISADGHYFVTQTISQMGCGESAEMIIWDTHSGEPINRIFTAYRESLITLSPDSKLMAWSSGEQVILTRLADGIELGRWRAHGRGIRALVFSEDSQLLLTVGEDLLVRAWDVSAAAQ